MPTLSPLEAVQKEANSLPKNINKFAKDIYLSLLAEGKPIYVNARGMSMYPFIKNGDRIKIEPINNKCLKLGDIVAVDMRQKQGPWFFAHRIVRIAGSNGNRIYFTKGDFHERGLDKPVVSELIAGKVTEIQREDIRIGLYLPLWQRLNSIIAKLSFKHPKILKFFLKYLILIVEWKLLFSKVKNRLKTGNPILYNTDSLILICSQKRLSEESKDEAKELIRKGINWQYFCEEVMKNGVTVLVYDSLSRLKPNSYIPGFLFDKLRAGYLYIVSKTVFQHKELIGLLGFFGEKQIPVIPLKGVLLSERLYRDIASRGLSADLDLMIKEEDREKAKITLEEAGYTLNLCADRQRQWQYNFTKRGSTIIDLQGDITANLNAKDRKDDLFKAVRLVERGGFKYYELKEEELLLFLSVHLVSSSCFRELRYICDINELLRNYKDTLDWESIIEKAKLRKISSSAYAALRLSREFFNSDVPLNVLSRLKPQIPSLLLLKIFANKKVFFRNCLRKRLIDNCLCYIFFELIEAQSLKEYITFFKGALLPPKEEIGNRSYILRFFKIISKVIR